MKIQTEELLAQVAELEGLLESLQEQQNLAVELVKEINVACTNSTVSISRNELVAEIVELIDNSQVEL